MDSVSHLLWENHTLKQIILDEKWYELIMDHSTSYMHFLKKDNMY